VLSNLPLYCTLIGLSAVVYSVIVARMIQSAPAGSERMQEISGAIKEGAIAYLNRQLKSMSIAGGVIFIIMLPTLGFINAIGFLVGATASFIAGYVGMRVSVIANVRTAEAAKQGLAAGLNMAFKGGSVTGMMVAGLALTSVAGFYALTHDVIALVALGFGGSLISIFARLGGGIFTKGADVGADLVGKVEAAFPKMIREIRPLSQTTSGTMSETAPAWPPTFLKLTPSPLWPPCFWATCFIPAI